jgi:hypothetical protein
MCDIDNNFDSNNDYNTYNNNDDTNNDILHNDNVWYIQMIFNSNMYTSQPIQITYQITDNRHIITTRDG